MFLSISEAAKLLDVCENTLRNWDENGKFRAIRTEGEHRRYSLEQVRAYLEENQKVENTPEEHCESDKLVNKWMSMLEDIYGEADKRSLAILLENAAGYIDSSPTDMLLFERPEYLQLTKDSWLKTRFRKMVTIQPLTGPCGLIYFMVNTDKSLAIQSEAVAAKFSMYNFKIFSKGSHVKASLLKDLYTDTIAAEIDNMILELLPRTSIETLQDAMATKSIESLQLHYDYVIGPRSLIDQLKTSKIATGVALYEIPTVLDAESFMPVAAAGRYPGKLTLPIFSPFLLICLGPPITNGTRSCMLRAGTYTQKNEKSLLC
jgi:excisionase family DNA binding protein